METEGVWRTICGRRVFIREGQSLTDAMRASGKFGKSSEFEELELDPSEYGYVAHNISSCFSRFKGKRICAIRLDGLYDDNDYRYIFVNSGFGRYKIIDKTRIDKITGVDVDEYISQKESSNAD